MEELIDFIVKKEIERFKDLEHAFGELNTDTIWTNSYYTVQLEGTMKRKLKPIFKGRTDEAVRELIKHYHLNVIKRRPELKEY